MSRTCPQCNLTLLGHQQHDSWEDCGPALRGKYQALLRRHALAVRRGDGKSRSADEWRIKAKTAEARLRELERGNPVARLERLEQRIAEMAERKAA